MLEEREIDRDLPGWFDHCPLDGVISRWGGPGPFRALRTLGAAVVDVSSRCPPAEFPRITTDDHAVGRMAAEHLLERCFHSFAFYGLKDDLWSTSRRDGFAEAVAHAGAPFEVFETSSRGGHRHPGEGQIARLCRWLVSLPKPVGVMVCKDLHGPRVLDACQRAGLRIPDEVAVIGADDDALLCEMNDPPLSSVICNPDQVGFEAAALLDLLMSGGKPEADVMLVPPVGVATRLSSDALAIGDTRVIDAVRFIHANACHGIDLRDVLQRVSVSRTTLDRQFQKYLHRTPQAEIRAVQLRRAKQLLTETDHSIHRIAELVGWKHAEYFHFAFKREFGTTPGRFREQSRPTKPRHTVG
jgi:LacI family transcriptional regulator